MRTAILLVLSGAVSMPVAATLELPKRGDTVLVTGCVSRGRIESNDMKVKDGNATFERLTTYRLTGDKKVLEGLKKEHDGHIEILTAVLRSELPIDESKKIGNTGIGIGLPGRNSPATMPPPPSLPVLEVKSAEHTATSCQ